MMGRGRGRGPDRDPSGETDDVGGVGRVGLVVEVVRRDGRG